MMHLYLRQRAGIGAGVAFFTIAVPPVVAGVEPPRGHAGGTDRKEEEDV